MANYILRVAKAEHFNQDDKREFIRKTVMWLFRGMGHLDYRKYVKEFLGKRGTKVKDSFWSSGYLMKNLKLAIFYQSVHQIEWEKLKRLFKLEDCDEKLVLYASRLIPSNYKEHRAFTLKEFDAEIKLLHSSLTPFTSKFVHRKMTFIIKSDNVSGKDITGDLLYLALQGVYWYYPRIESYPSGVEATKSHAANIAKNIIHNQGVNLINYCTRDCRSVMIHTADGGHQNSKLNLERSGNLDPQYNFAVPIATCTMSGDNTDDYDFTINQLVKHSNDTKWSTFIRLMGGKHDHIFTQWLRSHKITRTTNEDFYNQVAERRESSLYFNHVCNYLNLNHEQQQQYINQVRWLCC